MGCEQSSASGTLKNITTRTGNFISTAKSESARLKQSGLSELNLEERDLEEAATKIQAAYRSHRSKKTLKMAEQEEVDIDLEDPDVALAASRIQASFRGHQAKRATAKAEKAEAELNKKLETLSTNAEEELPDLSDPELDKAAVKIQAQFRTHVARKKDEKPEKTKESN